MLIDQVGREGVVDGHQGGALAAGLEPDGDKTEGVRVGPC